MIGTPRVSTKFRSSIATGCITGVVTALAVSALLTALQSGLIGSNKIGEGITSAVIFMIRVLSVTAGCYLAATVTKSHTLPVVGITAVTYLLLLTGIGIAAFDGSLKNFGSGMLSALVGGVIPCIIKLKTPKKSRKVRRLH